MQKKLFIGNKVDFEQPVMKVLRSFLKNEKVVFDKETFFKIPSGTLKDYTTIFLQSELLWYGDGPRLSFGGFKFAEQELRLQDVQARIVFVSKFDVSYFEGLNKLDYQILFAPGSDLLSVDDILDLKNLKEKSSLDQISEVNLFRVKYGYCDINDKVNTRMHTVKSEIDKRLKFGVDEGVLIGIESYVKTELQKLSEWFSDNEEYTNSIQTYISNLDFNEEADISDFIGSRFDLFKNKGGQEEGLSVTDFPNQRPWKVLILDDKPEDLFNKILDINGEELNKPYKEILNVKEVIIVKNVKDAKQKILFDEALFNDITVIICDLELQKENGMAQVEQGEDFIQWLEIRPHRHHTFLISHLTRDTIRKTIRKFKLNCSDYYKSELKGSQQRVEFKHFITEIYEKGDDNWEILMNSPTAERWSNSSKPKTSSSKKLPLKYGYNVLRNHIDYKYYEAYVTNEACKAIKSFEQSRKIPELKFPVSEYNYNSHGLAGLCHFLIARRMVIWLYEVKQVRNKLQIGKIIKPSTFDKREGILGLKKNWAIITSEKDKASKKIILVGNYTKINKVLGLKIKSGNQYLLGDVIDWAQQYNESVNTKEAAESLLQSVQVIETKIENKIPHCKISSVEDYEEEKQENSKKQMFSNLALNLEDLPFGILVEEKNWLSNHTEWNNILEDQQFRRMQASILNYMNELINSSLYKEKIKNIFLEINK